MGWYTSPIFGDGANQYCPDQCQHRDCAKARQDVASLCRICQMPIGGGVPIYFESDGIVHRDCAWAEGESQGSWWKQLPLASAAEIEDAALAEQSAESGERR